MKDFMKNKYLENLVDSFSALPLIGRKTARKLAYHLINQSKEEALKFADAIIKSKENIFLCEKCFNISEEKQCFICQDAKRENSIMVVENFSDIFHFEEMGEYQGKYFVLGGLLNPLEGISPSNLRFDSLIKLISEEKVKELILGFNQSLEGDTTALYIKQLLEQEGICIYRLAKGMPQGSEIEYTDRFTLKEALKNKTLF